MQDRTQIQEIMTEGGQANGNRVFVFSGEGRLMQMVRDLVSQIGTRVTNRADGNVEVVGNQQNVEENVQTTVSTINDVPTSSLIDSNVSNIVDAGDSNFDLDSVNTQHQQLHHNQIDLDLSSAHDIEFINENIETEETTIVDRTVLTNAEIHAENVYHQIQTLPTQHLTGRNSFQSILLPTSSSLSTKNTNAVDSTSNNINYSSVMTAETTAASNNSKKSRIQSVMDRSSNVSQSLRLEGGIVEGQSGTSLHDNEQKVDSLISKSTAMVDEISITDTTHENSSID